MADTSLKNKPGDLPPTETPPGNLPDENNPGDNGLSTNGDGELDEKTKTGFQRLVAKKDTDISNLTSKLEEIQRERDALKKVEQDRKLAEMTETERLKAERDDYERKFVKSELKSFVTAELTKRDLMKNPLAEDIIESPWLLKVIKSHLPEQPGWDETIEVVKEYLPAYLDTLVVPVTVPNAPLIEDTPIDVVPPTVPTGRETPPNTPSNKRVWTRAEIDRVKADNDLWLKYREDITLAYTENRVV